MSTYSLSGFNKEYKKSEISLMYSSNSSIEISNLKISPSRKDVFMGAYCWGKEVQKLGPSFPFFYACLKK